MPHYVCPVCKGVSEHPKSCETDGCSLHGHALVECICTDGQHQEVLTPKSQ